MLLSRSKSCFALQLSVASFQLSETTSAGTAAGPEAHHAQKQNTGSVGSFQLPIVSVFASALSKTLCSYEFSVSRFQNTLFCLKTDNWKPTTVLLSFHTSVRIRRGRGTPHTSLCTDIRSDWLTAARPEAYQNLIYILKDQQTPLAIFLERSRKGTRTDKPAGPTLSQANQTYPIRFLLRRTDQATPIQSLNTRLSHPKKTWRKTGGDYRDRTDDPLLAKQVLSQLS